MRALAFLVLAASCGGSPKPAPPKPAQPPTMAAGSGAGSAAVAITPTQVCKRLVELSTQKCGGFASMNVEEASCLRELAQTADDPALGVFEECVVQPSCEEVTNCLLASRDTVDARLRANPRTCDDTAHYSRVVAIPPDEWARRNGAGVKRFVDVTSTKARPVEMCTVKEANEWLMSLTCADGSRLRGDPEAARTGNVGQGGRCSAVIDRYEVSCPEKRYEIFIDAYVCPKQ